MNAATMRNDREPRKPRHNRLSFQSRLRNGGGACLSLHMKLLLAVVLVAFIASPVAALSIFTKIGGPRECPDNLQIEVKPAARAPGLHTVSVHFTPREFQNFDGTTGAVCILTVNTAETPVARVRVHFTKHRSEWSGSFNLHPSTFATSEVRISSHLIARDGLPIVGGGIIYEVALRGFLP